MKKLQNNFTTPEQSKRLLELGVPVDSADCYYYEPLGERNFVYVLQNGSPLKETERRQRIIVHPDTKLYPCWSVGRLIEMIGICHQPIPTEMRIATSNIIEYLLDIFDTIADGSGFDFSKLEE